MTYFIFAIRESWVMYGRRRYLATLGAGAMGLLAGCEMIPGRSTPEGTATETAQTFDGEQVAKLAPEDGDPLDGFGHAVDIDEAGETVLVGAPGAEGPYGTQFGLAYVFRRTDGWEMEAALVGESPDEDDRFGEAVALSNDGATALVGAIGEEGSDDVTTTGAAYIFDRDGGEWPQQARLTDGDGTGADAFGDAVALDGSGTTALVGASGDDNDNGSSAGTAYIFTGDDGSWTRQATLTADDGDSDDRFAHAVALDDAGTTALLGAWWDDGDQGVQSGAAYLFDGSSDEWTQTTRLTADGGHSLARFGSAVRLAGDGSTALVAAQNATDPATTPDGSDDWEGVAYVFVDGESGWQQRAALTDETDDDIYLGSSVALTDDGTTALVGASTDSDPAGSPAGKALRFDGSGTDWSHETTLTADDGDDGDRFGNAVALNGAGTRALVGARNDEDPNGGADRPGINAGSAYIFE